METVHTTEEIMDYISKKHEKQILPEYTWREVSKHCSVDSCWIVVRDKVYNVTEFLALHPGGLEIILENGGYDSTIPFELKGHSQLAFNVLEKYLIGVIVAHERIEKD